MSQTVFPFDMSLGLTSDDISLADVRSRLGLPIEHLHIKGHPIAGKPPIAGRIATRHYVALAHQECISFSDVTGWLNRTIATVQGDAVLARQLKSRQVDALFWIAMFGRDPVPTPALDADLVSSIDRLHAQVMIENYTPTCPDYPTKTWFPHRVV